MNLLPLFDLKKTDNFYLYRLKSENKENFLVEITLEFRQYYITDNLLPENVWLGVTVEAKATRERIGTLRTIPASIRFLSCEPLLEDLENIDLSNIHWVIVGGESGKRAKPMKEEWVLNIEKQAFTGDSAFFFKQWGTWGADGVKRSKNANGK